MPDPGATFDVRRYAEVDSTNRVAREMAREGAPEGLVIVADHQTAGRGRLGRSWVAPPGSSLLVTVVLRPQLLAERRHLVTIAVAVAARDACASVAGVAPDLKWPNDLLLGDRKVGGILAEAEEDAVVVGLGLNVNWPDDVPEGATALNHAAGRAVDRETLLTAWLEALRDRYATLEGTVAEYRDVCATLGRHVRVDLGGNTLEGTAEAISEDGHLVVTDGDGEPHVISAGDVVHLRGA